MTSKPVEQPEASVIVGPLIPSSIDTWLTGAWVEYSRQVRGSRERKPFVRNVKWDSSIFSNPLMHVPKQAATWWVLAGGISNFRAFRALRAGTTANCEKRQISFARRRAMNSSGLKFLTSAAIRQGNGVGSKAVIQSTADLPAMRFCQKVSLPIPLGATTPRPVITTRRVFLITEPTSAL